MSSFIARLLWDKFWRYEIYFYKIRFYKNDIPLLQSLLPIYNHNYLEILPLAFRHFYIVYPEYKNDPNIFYSVERFSRIKRDKIGEVGSSKSIKPYPMIHPKLYTYVLCDNVNNYPKALKSPLHRIKSSYKNFPDLDEEHILSNLEKYNKKSEVIIR